MYNKINVSLVSYLNSRPFYYGINKSIISDKINLTLDTPARCAEKLQNGEAQLGLVPVAIIPQIANAEIVSDYCISASGKVNSVLLLSNVPVNHIEKIILDNQSRTSVLLAKILALKHWCIEPQWLIESDVNNLNDAKNQTAAVVIGDRAIAMRKEFAFCYDLAEEWQLMTALPFVFACWVTNTKLDNSFTVEFNQALENGINSIDVLATEDNLSSSSVDYLKNSIEYILSEKKKKAIDLFLSLVTELQVTDEKFTAFNQPK
jgi:chorismate dehydratase